jgi:hypothetical protein
MQKRLLRWLVGAACAVALVAGLAFGDSRPTVVHGAEPTPTPTPLHTDGNPGGGGGSGGGG